MYTSQTNVELLFQEVTSAYNSNKESGSLCKVYKTMI